MQWSDIMSSMIGTVLGMLILMSMGAGYLKFTD